MLAHNVYFRLKDRSPEATQALIAACKKHLTGHPGEVFFACGTLAAELDRPVNVRDWDVAITDTVADNASSGVFVLGDARVPLEDFDPRGVEMTLTRDGETISSGNGAACLGDPLDALAWLARAAAHYGSPLRAGDVVLSGALGPMAPVGPGDVLRGQISSLGGVSVRFGEERQANGN